MSTPIGLIVPGLPHPLLAPQASPHWGAVRAGFDAARAKLEASDAEIIVVYSSMWASILGHQMQADPNPEWVHVDELFHALGSIPYKFRIDAEFAERWRDAALARGLAARTVSYTGFPIDTGSVVALKLLNPDNRLPAAIVSSNIYSDRAETVVLGKATRDAIGSRKAAIVVVSTLSNRIFTDWIDPLDDRIHSPKDDEWNRKLLEFLGAGRLEDTAQLSREIHKQIRIHKVVSFKSLWWMSAVMGQHNRYRGQVHAYAPVYGTGSAVVSLEPTQSGVGDKEFDEEDVDVYTGDRNVITSATGGSARDRASSAKTEEAE